MKYCIVLGLFLGSVGAAQDHSAHTQATPATLMQGYGDLQHPVSTNNPQAQQFFDQGLRQIYAFNHDEAAQSFQRAAELDPKLAMAHWGVALALGPNINIPVDADRERQAFAEAARASALAGAANATPRERAYIEALATRYSADSAADLQTLSVRYREAMKNVTWRFPSDLDAATLYAESIMDLHPWMYWSAAGKPEEGTEEVV